MSQMTSRSKNYIVCAHSYPYPYHFHHTPYPIHDISQNPYLIVITYIPPAPLLPAPPAPYPYLFLLPLPLPISHLSTADDEEPLHTVYLRAQALNHGHESADSTFPTNTTGLIDARRRKALRTAVADNTLLAMTHYQVGRQGGLGREGRGYEGGEGDDEGGRCGGGEGGRTEGRQGGR